MHSERLPSSRKIRFKIIEACDKKIKEIDRQKEASLKWHISKMEKLRNKKWKSLVGPAPVQNETVEAPRPEEIPPDVAMTRATSFYAWGENNSGQRSIITSTKPPDDLIDVTSEDIPFSEVTKFYQDGTEAYENHNSLLRLYPKEPITPPKRKMTKTHIYIPHVNREGRVVREGGMTNIREPAKQDFVDSSLEFENGINLEKFKENLRKKIPRLGQVNKVPEFPESPLNRRKQSLADLIHEIEQRKARIPNIRSRSNSRLSQALREIEDEPTLQESDRHLDDEFSLCLDGNLSTEEFSNARICSLLEREDKSQNSTLFIKGSGNNLSKLSFLSSVKRRDENLNLSMNDMGELHYVRRIGGVEVSKHDTSCGCDRYSNSSQSKRSLFSKSLDLY